jgi:hypothetical protein
VPAKLLATADIHSPKYFARFREAVEGLGKFDAVLIAGDLMEDGKIDGLKILMNELKKLSDTIMRCQEMRIMTMYYQGLRALALSSGLMMKSSRLT